MNLEGKVAVYGLGNNFNKKKKFIIENIKPDLLIDKDANLWGKEIISGIKCYSPDHLDKSDINIVIIAPENGFLITEIKNKLMGKYEIYTLNQLWDEKEIELQRSVDFGEEDSRIKHFSCELGSCACNIGCSYCYVDFLDPNLKNTMNFSHTIPFIIKALSRKRLGGRAFFNMCGEGETLLKPGYIELVRGLLGEGHYVGIITNGTVTSKLKELLTFSEDYKSRILCQFSLHYTELKKKNLLDTYFENVNIMRAGGVSVCTTMPGAEEYIPLKDEIKQACLQKIGFLPVISTIRTSDKGEEGFPFGLEMKWDEYKAIWSDYSSNSIKMRNDTMGKINQICYAGINSGWINFETGELRSCCPGEHLDNIYDNIKRKIKFYDSPHKCIYGYCSNNGIFLSGRINDSIKLPTWYEMFSCVDSLGNSTFSEEIRNATDYCCEY